MTSEYEQNVGALLAEKQSKLVSLKNNANVDKKEIKKLELEIESLNNLYDNYNLGMNYFRRARGDRSGLRE